MIEQSPTGGAVTVDLDVTFLQEGTGSGTVTATPPGRTLSKTDNAIYEFKVANGTTVSLLAKPDAGSYFVGWSPAARVGQPSFRAQTRSTPAPSATPAMGGSPSVLGRTSPTCPMPGTFVNDPNESVCPGVTVIHD